MTQAEKIWRNRFLGVLVVWLVIFFLLLALFSSSWWMGKVLPLMFFLGIPVIGATMGKFMIVVGKNKADNKFLSVYMIFIGYVLWVIAALILGIAVFGVIPALFS